MCRMWPAALLAAMLGHVQAFDHSECYRCSNGIQPKPSRTLIQVQQREAQFEQIVEDPAENENDHGVDVTGIIDTAPGLPHARAKAQHLRTANFELKPHLEKHSVAVRLKKHPKIQHRHAASIEIRTHLETNSTPLGLQTRAKVQHLPATSIEIKTNSTTTAPNITHKSHQQHGPTGKAGICAVQWLQMLYVKSRRKIEAMVNGRENEMPDLSLVLQYVLGFAILVCLPLTMFMAYLGSEQGFPLPMPFLAFFSGWGSSMGTDLWHSRRSRQALSPRASSFSRSPSGKRASTPSGSSFPQQRKQDQQQQQQQQHQQQHKHLWILPVQSRNQSRQHMASLPPTPAEDVCPWPCICQELRVPEGKECCLLLPRIKAEDVRQPGRCTIDSPDGAAVFSLKFGSSWRTSSHGKRLLTLQSAVKEGAVFASCDAVALDQGEPEKLLINDRDGKHFADMQTCGRDKSVMLSPCSGTSATIRYEDRAAGRIEITDSNGRILAIAEVIDDSLQAVRICAMVDAGLVAITMLGFNLLKLEHGVGS